MKAVLSNSFDSTNIPVKFRFAVILALVEVGLGSFMHAFRIPFTGYVLSLHQAFCLTRALLQEHSYKEALRIPVMISNVAAILKSFSPMGKKLTPMIALVMQGALFNLGICLFGNTILGQSVGAILLSLWGFMQPLLISYLIFGDRLIDGFIHFQTWMSSYFAIGWWGFLVIAGFCLVFKAFLAVIAVFTAHFLKEERLIRYQHFFIQPFPLECHSKSRVRQVFKDILSPWFIGSCIFSGIALYITQAETIEIIYAILRIIASMLLFFLVVRLLNMNWLLSFLDQKGFIRFSQTLTQTLSVLKLYKPAKE